MGTSSVALTDKDFTRDHPHACGDKSIAYSLIPSITGSSPRVWGQAMCKNNYKYLKRIIPTRVGTSLLHSCKHRCYEDHPHACGDKNWLVGYGNDRAKSSPRVWGQERIQTAICSRCRIIPTRVGTSPLQNLISYVIEDHPHACGDKFLPYLLYLRRGGSSPRVWGQEKDYSPFVQHVGIIPTRVGTSYNHRFLSQNR